MVGSFSVTSAKPDYVLGTHLSDDVILDTSPDISERNEYKSEEERFTLILNRHKRKGATSGHFKH